MVVPAGAAPGQSWSGSFTGHGGGSGTWNGSTGSAGAAAAGYSSTANGRAGGATPITATATLGATLLTARPS
jgi:hypothetical protein